MDKITQVIISIKSVEEKFRKIQKNPSLYGAEYGLTTEEHELLEKLIYVSGEVNIAADAIIKRASS